MASMRASAEIVSVERIQNTGLYREFNENCIRIQHKYECQVCAAHLLVVDLHHPPMHHLHFVT